MAQQRDQDTDKHPDSADARAKAHQAAQDAKAKAHPEAAPRPVQGRSGAESPPQRHLPEHSADATETVRAGAAIRVRRQGDDAFIAEHDAPMGDAPADDDKPDVLQRPAAEGRLGGRLPGEIEIHGTTARKEEGPSAPVAPAEAGAPIADAGEAVPVDEATPEDFAAAGRPNVVSRAGEGIDAPLDAVTAAPVDPDAAAKDAALSMLLHRHGGSVRIEPGTVGRIGKKGQTVRVVRDGGTGETYVRLTPNEG